MRFQGRLRKDGQWWLAEVPVFDAMTQGHSRKEALAMITDWFATIVGRKGRGAGRGSSFPTAMSARQFVRSLELSANAE
jgi:hypothetical protein